jgi:hypothetical protein
MFLSNCESQYQHPNFAGETDNGEKYYRQPISNYVFAILPNLQYQPLQ